MSNYTYFHICILWGWCDRRLWAWRMHSWSCSGDTFPAAFGCTGTLDSPSSLPCSMRHCGLRWDEEGKRLALLHSREPMHSSYTARSPPLRMRTAASRRCPWLPTACCTPWLPKDQWRYKELRIQIDFQALAQWNGYLCVVMEVEIVHGIYMDGIWPLLTWSWVGRPGRALIVWATGTFWNISVHWQKLTWSPPALNAAQKWL